MTDQACDICGTEIMYGGTTDVMVSRTEVQQGEVVRIMQEVPPSDVSGWSYVVICNECQDRFMDCWQVFLRNIGVI